MRDELFFYPHYPYEDEDLLYRNQEDFNGLFDPENTLRYGNAFKDLYRPYRNIEPGKVVTDSLKDKEIYTLMTYLKLYLDVYPQDKKMYQAYVTYLNKYKTLKEKLAEKKIHVCPETSRKEDGEFMYLYKTSPWLK